MYKIKYEKKNRNSSAFNEIVMIHKAKRSNRTQTKV